MYIGAEQAIFLVLEHEGGYVNHPNDPGGETKYGISKRAYPNLDIKNLTEKQAVGIYMRDYWERLKAGKIPAGLDLCVMDTAVNSGVSRAVKWLQQLVGSVPDGVIGPKTLAAVQEQYEQDPKELINAYMDHRLGFLQSLKTWDTFGKGWSRRVEKTREYALKQVTTG